MKASQPLLEHLHVLSGARIGILGAGYIGERLATTLEKHKERFAFQTYLFNRIQLAGGLDDEFDYFFNCAGNTGDFRTRARETVESNPLLAAQLADNLRVRKAFIALSSTRVYGFSSGPTDPHFETEALSAHPESAEFVYDGSKLLAEAIYGRCIWSFPEA
jgi:nucleoside-diphosphate-sugar epimerase